MKVKLLLALLPVACLFCQAHPACAQSSPGLAPTAQSASSGNHRTGAPTATGRIAGILKDPSGAIVQGARIEVRNRALGITKIVETNAAGRFACDGLPEGLYQVTVLVPGFESVLLRDLAVTAGQETTANVALKVAGVRTDVEVGAAESEPASASRRTPDASEQAQSRNTAEMVAVAPGVSLRENGQLASIPLLHGLGDERTKLVVEGMTVSSACPNHMNAPLTYTAPAQAAQVTVLAGITPVSLGGDSLGGTVSIESRSPVFANPGERLHLEGATTGFYRSNGQNYGGALTEWFAGRHLALGYNGSWTTNDDYTDGAGHKVTSTYAQSTDHSLTLAAQGAGNLVTLEASLHHTPYEGFPGAQMDLVRNYAESLNLHGHRGLGQGVLDARVFWQNTWHAMNIGHDKSAFPMPMNMPMNTHGRDLGYSVLFERPLTARQTLRVGNEFHRFQLDDRWPAVPGTAPMMGPNTFVNIHNGRRLRLGTFAEVASRWSPQWSTLLGLRNDTVWTNAGPVQGYSEMMYGADADAFNASSRSHTDPDFDLTALARYQPNAASAFEFGYARKTRAPNLYERYAWSTNWMASGMIGWFNDGNYYVGSLGLKPEIAHTVSGAVLLRGGGPRAWEAKASPYFTHIQNFVDVDTLDTTMYGMSTFAKLRFANHNARIYGADLAGNATLWDSSSFGRGRLSGVGGWLHGERLDTRTGLYQMMPLNARLALDEEMKGITAGLGLQAVDRKSHLDPNRMEQPTPGYALFNFHTAYRREHLQAAAAADNLFNRNYALPLGGVNFDDFMASMWMSQIKPLTGRGRSVSFSLTASF
jgi:iron complex outermembrane receptor protein